MEILTFSFQLENWWKGLIDFTFRVLLHGKIIAN